MGGGMCPGHMMMGKMMTECQMVATSDGGVIVKMGTMLMKYDKDLMMVKEVTMKVDTDAMMKKMMEETMTPRMKMSPRGMTTSRSSS